MKVPDEMFPLHLCSSVAGRSFTHICDPVSRSLWLLLFIDAGYSAADMQWRIRQGAIAIASHRRKHIMYPELSKSKKAIKDSPVYL